MLKISYCFLSTSKLVNIKRLHLREILFKIGSSKIVGCDKLSILHVLEKQNQAQKFDLIYRDNLHEFESEKR